jgi:hypothetical protein
MNCAFKGRALILTAAAKALITVQAERELWSSCLFGLQSMLFHAVPLLSTVSVTTRTSFRVWEPIVCSGLAPTGRA